MKPRLSDVAERAGVSQATVSRVLNERPGVAKATRRQVRRALDALGYEPAGLRRRARRPLIGLIIGELNNPVYPRFAQAIESRLARRGLTTVLCSSTPAGLTQAEYLNVLLEHDVAGVVAVSADVADVTTEHDHYRDLLHRRIPVVVVNGRPSDFELPAITVDHADAARQATAHLVSLGHRRVGLAAGPLRYIPSQEFVRGFEAATSELDVAEGAAVSETLYTLEGGHTAGLELGELGVTGIVCASDLIALGVVRAVRELGARVPDDVSVVGFDDAGLNGYFDPPLTSLRQPFGAMSAAILRMLEDRLRDPDGPTTELRFRAELVVRGSTARAPRGSGASPESPSSDDGTHASVSDVRDDTTSGSVPAS